MATIYKGPNSKNYLCQFRDVSGRRVTRSTGTRDMKQARATAEAWERAARLASKHELTQATAVRVINHLLESIGAEVVDDSTISDHFNGFIEERERTEAAPATVARYRGIVKRFLDSLPPGRRSARLQSLSSGEIQTWYDAELASGKTPKTAALGLAVIRSALETKRRHGLFSGVNPADAVKRERGREDEREAFTDKEVSALLQSADKEWKGMIALGAHCGLRIGDAANLTWSSVDLENSLLRFWPSKTRRTASKPLEIILHPEVVHYLSELEPGIGAAPLFPSLHGTSTGSHGGLSNAFARLMVTARIDVSKGREKTGLGRRTRNKGFHSLRHTLVTRLAQAGVSEDIRRAIAGHSSASMSQKYLHLTSEAQRESLGKVSWIGGVK